MTFCLGKEISPPANLLSMRLPNSIIQEADTENYSDTIGIGKSVNITYCHHICRFEGHTFSQVSLSIIDREELVESLLSESM